MRFRVLGPLQVAGGDGRWLPVRSVRQRSLLAMLLFQAGEFVPAERLVDAVWLGRPPKSYTSNLHTYVSRLRERIAPVPIESNGGGYRVCVADGDLDLLVFRAEAGRGRHAARASDPAAAAAHLRCALDQWRDRPLADLSLPALEADIARLEAERLAAFEDRMAAELAAGRHAEVIGELRGALVEHPLSERLAGQLMTALRLSGRPADALAVYRGTRAVLVEETGLEPGPELRQVHAEVLEGEPRRGQVQPVQPVRQLPADVADFCGRTREVAAVAAALRAGPLVVLSGQPGVGKSAMAVRVAHRLRAEFPDGQLYAQLAGARCPREPADVLADWLTALGVPASAIPGDPHARAAAFRSRVADRRILVLLDDAADPAQVRPLLPGTPSCAVLVTSRSRLSGLAGAHPVPVRPFTAAEAGLLLRRIAGDRPDAEPADAARIARACGHLPLALRIAGTRLALRPQLRLGSLADRLEDELHRLDELAVSDLRVRSSLALSYEALSPAARTTLRLIGIVDVPNLPALAISVLREGLDADNGDDGIEELIESSLLEPSGVDGGGEPRYQVHDLVLAFARELALAEDGRSERELAGCRLVEVTYALADLAAHRLPRAMPAPELTGVAPRPELASTLVRRVLDDPGAWFATERPTLVAGLGVLCRIGQYRTAMLLFERFGRYLWLHGHYDDLESCAVSLAAAATAAGDMPTAAQADAVLALLDHLHGRYARAVAGYRRAADRLDQRAHRQSRGWALINLATCMTGLGRCDEALALATTAEGLFDADDLATLTVRRTRSAALHRLGRPLEAVRIDTEALALARRWGEPYAVAVALHSLSWSCAITGRLDRAAELAEESVALLRPTTARSALARSLRALGAIRAGSGRRAEALEAFGEALGIATELDERPRVLSCTRALAAGRIGAGRPDEAIAELRACLAAYREMGGGSAMVITLRLLAAAYRATGETSAAEDAAREADALHDPRDASTATVLRMLSRLAEPGRAGRPPRSPGTAMVSA